MAAETAEAAFSAKYGGAILVVIDVESDGPSVRANSMFALGGVAIRVATKTVLGGFSFAVLERPGASKNVETMKFWMAPEQKPMYDALHVGATDMARAMGMLAEWVDALRAARPGANLMFASDCAVYDWKWIDAELTEHVRPLCAGLLGHGLVLVHGGRAQGAAPHGVEARGGAQGGGLSMPRRGRRRARPPPLQ